MLRVTAACNENYTAACNMKLDLDHLTHMLTESNLKSVEFITIFTDPSVQSKYDLMITFPYLPTTTTTTTTTIAREPGKGTHACHISGRNLEMDKLMCA